jgi:hypothetical protein
MLAELNAQNALVFRIVHINNVPWILDHGLHCRNSRVIDPNFVQIGNADLINGRHHRTMQGSHGGTLSDYVPFYFTSRSPMFLNIKTGYRGIQQRKNQEIAILFASLHNVKKRGLPFVFTDRHAYLEAAQPPFDDLAHLSKIDWAILQRSDFKRDPENPQKVERYEAEALIHKHLPIDALDGIACCDTATATVVEKQVKTSGKAIKVVVKPAWYF